MKTNFQTIILLLTFAGMAMVGCTDDLDIVGVRPSEVICFTASLGDPTVSGTSRSSSGHLAIEEEEWILEGVATEEANSRGGLSTSLSGSAGVIGIDDETLEFSFKGDELISVGAPVYWKDKSKQNFDVYAYAPYDVTTVDAEDKTIAFTVADEVSDQKDVIVASRTIVYNTDEAESDFNKSVPLTFNHILTAVRFKLGFEGTVKTITVSGVKNQGTYSMKSGTWSGQSGDLTYKITSTAAGNELLMIPQAFETSGGALVKLECTNGTILTAPLDGQVWKPGKLITYTLYEGSAPKYIYFDLAAGNVLIGCTETTDAAGKIIVKSEDTYTGYVFKNGEKTLVTGQHAESKIYYVYQTSEDNPGTSTLPNYRPVTYNNKPWADFIKNNTSVAGVIQAWREAASTVGRTATNNRIRVYGSDKVVNLTIDNIYSTYAERSVSRTTAGIGFNAGENSKLTITTVGDNRVSAIHYHGGRDKNNELILEGTGSLTVAAASGKTQLYGTHGETAENDTTFTDNHWCSAIGGNDSSEGNSCGIIINSGNIFAGTTKAENCTAIGAGGNDKAIITINGGTITAVATTTGTAIGGGIGFNSSGGVGEVTINNGNVYAYNHANRWGIPSSAIGGAGSYKSVGTIGTVTIADGYVYAYSALGTAIGGGSSQTEKGGTGNVTINGGMVIAKTGNRYSASIGGGTGNSGGAIYNEGNTNDDDLWNSDKDRNGGDAKVTINGGVVRTGSIGGGGTGMAEDKIGNATVIITGGDIQAQCILAAGSGGTPSFNMTGGVLRNSNVINTPDAEYSYVKDEGGAVYLEDGTCTIGGTARISNCTATKGGAIYIKGQTKTDGTYTASFTMNGGTIEKCTSTTDGGAVYLTGGNITLTGGTIQNNLAQDGNGGGFYLMEGSFNMSNATIRDNSAIYRNSQQGNGGGVYITSSNAAQNNVDIKIASGTITGNTSDRLGGGICIQMPEVKVNGQLLLADVTVGGTSAGPNISGNNAIMKGGGLYVEGAGTFNANYTVGESFYGFNTRITVNGGTINDNSTTAYVPNDDLVNEGGIVTLNGGNVPSVTVTFHGNGGKTVEGGQEVYTQKIVKATNNVLIVPAFKHTSNPSLVIKSWNTRRDGQGTDKDENNIPYMDYAADDNKRAINLTENLELYAIWSEK